MYGDMEGSERREYARPASPHFRLYSHWSASTFALCVCLVTLSVLAFVAIFALVREDISSLFLRVSLETGEAVYERVPYGTLIFLALIPVLVIGTAVWLIDRWEPEPVIMYVVTFAWGAGVSLVVARYAAQAWEFFASSIAESAEEYSFLVIVVGAGLIEEMVKGSGLLVIFFSLRKYLNGPMDGIVYGLLVGLGFAFSENIFYFAHAFAAELLEGRLDLSGMETWTLGAVFFTRAVLSPLVHPLATAIIGVMVGAASVTRRPGRTVWPLALVGWLIAALLHGLHNWSSLAHVADSPQMRLLFNLPAYIGAIILIYYAAGFQRKQVRLGLEYYRDIGCISSNEVAMVMNMANRKRARQWAEASAAELGREAGQGKRAMRAMHNELIQLGYSRTVNTRRGITDTDKVRVREARQLRSVMELRRIFAQ